MLSECHENTNLLYLVTYFFPAVNVLILCGK